MLEPNTSLWGQKTLALPDWDINQEQLCFLAQILKQRNMVSLVIYWCLIFDKKLFELWAMTWIRKQTIQTSKENFIISTVPVNVDEGQVRFLWFLRHWTVAGSDSVHGQKSICFEVVFVTVRRGCPVMSTHISPIYPYRLAFSLHITPSDLFVLSNHWRQTLDWAQNNLLKY